MIRPNLPSGIVEYIPKNYTKFQNLRAIVSKVYHSYGYLSLETSILQNLETLSSGGEISKEVYSIGRAKAEEGSEELSRGLRFDLTKPLARYIAQNHGQIGFPFKRSEIGLVYRGERPQRGRFRQFYQADYDVIGRETLALDYDAEMIEVAASVFEALDIGQVVIRFNNRKLLQAIIESYGVGAEQFSATLIYIDKLEKVGVEATKESLVSLGITLTNVSKIITTVIQKIELAQIPEFLEKIEGEGELLQQARNEVQTVSELISAEQKNVTIMLDLSIVRGLEYYTGTVFETNLVGFEQYGSVCSGGRYENLVEDFANVSFPGVGGSVGLTRLFAIFEDENLEFSNVSAKDILVYVAIASPERSQASREYARRLRSQGNIVYVAASHNKLKKQFELAAKINIDEVHILEADGTVTIKTMTTGEQRQEALS